MTCEADGKRDNDSWRQWKTCAGGMEIAGSRTIRSWLSIRYAEHISAASFILSITSFMLGEG